MPLILALIVAVVLIGAVVWIASSGWLVRSGLEDLARRRRLLQGTDPLQLTAQRALDSAHRSHRLALEALGDTVDTWYALQTTLGIGTTLEAGYRSVKYRADTDPEFATLLERANAACTAALEESPDSPLDSVADLVSETARLDSMTMEIRSYIHRARPASDL